MNGEFKIFINLDRASSPRGISIDTDYMYARDNGEITTSKEAVHIRVKVTYQCIRGTFLWS